MPTPPKKLQKLTSIQSKKLGRLPYGYKFVDGNVGVSGKKVTLPHYMAMFI